MDKIPLTRRDMSYLAGHEAELLRPITRRLSVDAILHWYRRRYLPCPYQRPERRPPASAHIFHDASHGLTVIEQHS